MPRVRRRVAALFLILLAPPGAATAAAPPDVTALAWLTGCWARENAAAGSGEQWMPPAGGTMFGVGRTVSSEGRTVEHEFLQIRVVEGPTLGYIAMPSGQAQTTFRLLRLEERGVVFEDPAHDFPQRVSYRRVGDRLEARIEGMRKGKLEGIDFPMRRVDCETWSDRQRP